MKAKDCLLYSKNEFKTIADAWSHIVNSLSFPIYYPEGYEPKDKDISKNWALETEELFEEFKKYDWIYLNDKGNWTFKNLKIEEALEIVSY